MQDTTTETTPASASRRVYMETFGCQMNVADSEIALARLDEAGYEQVFESDEADVILFNTCSVRDNAEAKVRGRLDALKRRKREDPELTIGVMGCMAQRAKEDLVTNHPHVDLVVGPDQFVHLPQLIDRLDDEAHVIATEFGDFEADRNWSARRSEGINAWIPVMRGCNYNCTYCIVPKTRGREKSRDPALIEEEVRQAVANGYVQVTLLGQTVDAYGKTLGDGTTLATLLRRLDAVEGLQRLRFVTSHPKDITDDLLLAMHECQRVCTHLHVPAQSGSSRVLRLMGRRYTREDYLDLVERARRLCPKIELLTDIIVGFPTETDEDFAATRTLMEEVGFDGAYVFMYSPRPGTGASRLPDDVPTEIKRARCNDLLALQLNHQEELYQTFIGETFEVLVEGVSKSNQERLHGRSWGNRNIVFPRSEADGTSRDHLIGTMVSIRIDSATNLTLYGDLV